MYEFFEGKIVTIELNRVVVETGGIGYILQISGNSLGKFVVGKTARVLSHLVVVDGEPRLYGFADTTERDIFRLLTSVSGVGPSTALSVLSQMTPPQLIRALASSDEAALRQVKGVGAKTAGRLVVELREAAQKLGFADPQAPVEALDAIAALTALGFQRLEAQRLMDAARREYPTGSSEELVKAALAASRRK